MYIYIRMYLKSQLNTNMTELARSLMTYTIAKKVGYALIGERARHYQGYTNSSWCGTYIYIARCQVVVKFYRDLYFGYSPRCHSCGHWTDIDF